MTYIITIAATVLAIALSDRCKGALKYILLATGIIIPCIIAGCRDNTVGTDVLVYGHYTYVDAIRYGYFDFMNSFQGRTGGFGFASLAWISANVLKNEAVYFGLLQMATIIPFHIGVRKVCQGAIWPSTLYYMLLIFPLSLCLMKQMIAASILIAAFSYCKNGQPVKYFVANAIAISFHYTSAIGLIFYFIYREINLRSQGKSFFGRSTLQIILLGSLLVFGIFGIFWQEIIIIFSTIKDSYNIGLMNYDSTSFNWTACLMLFPTLIGLLMYAREKKKGLPFGSADNLFYLVVLLIGFLLMELGMFASALSRFAYYAWCYGGIFCSLNLSRTSSIEAKNTSRVLLVCLMGYFAITTFIQNIGNIYPYTSQILGV